MVKVRDDDEGELDIVLSIEGDVIMVDFTKPVTWLGLNKGTAMGLVELLGQYIERLP